MTPVLLAGLLCSQLASPLDDPLLSKAITVRADAEPIHVTLRNISDQTGVKVYANLAVGQDRIILLAKNLPAKDILKRISDHYGWSWRSVKDGIELWQTPVQATEERRALQEAILKPLRKWRQASVDALAARQKFDVRKGWARLDQLGREFIDQSVRYNDEYYGTPEQQKVWVNRQGAIEKEAANIARSVSPVWHLVDTLIAGLTDQDLLQIEDGDRMILAYAPKGGQRGMPPRARQLCEELVRFLTERNLQGDVERAISQALEIDESPNLRPDRVRNLRLLLKNDSFPVVLSRDRPFDLPRFFIVDTDLKLVTQSYIEQSWEQRAPEPAVKPAAAARDQLDEPLQRTAGLGRASEIVSQRALKVAEEARDNFFRAGGKTFLSAGQAFTLNEIASAAHVNFISDCYDWNRIGGVNRQSLTTARQAFQFMAGVTQQTWTYEDGWVNFRDPKPAVGRAYTIPSDKLLKLRDLLVGPFSLDAGGAAANLITERQSMGILAQNWFYQRWGILARGEANYLPLLRFWGTLPRGPKRSLEAGDTVPLASIGRASLGHLMTYLNSKERPSNVSSLEFGEILDAEDHQWVKENWPSRSDYDNDTDLTELLPNGPDPRATISMRRTEGLAFQVVSRDDSWSTTMSLASSVRSGYFSPERDEFKFRLLPEIRNLFTVDLAPNLRRGIGVNGFGTPAEKVYERIADLPADLRAKLEAQRLKNRGS